MNNTTHVFISRAKYRFLHCIYTWRISYLCTIEIGQVFHLKITTNVGEFSCMEGERVEHLISNHSSLWEVVCWFVDQRWAWCFLFHEFCLSISNNCLEVTRVRHYFSQWHHRIASITSTHVQFAKRINPLTNREIMWWTFIPEHETKWSIEEYLSEFIEQNDTHFEKRRFVLFKSNASNDRFWRNQVVDHLIDPSLCRYFFSMTIRNLFLVE